MSQNEVVIIVKGGNVQDILSTTKDIKVYLIDYDNLMGLVDNDDHVSYKEKEEYEYSFEFCSKEFIKNTFNEAIKFVTNLWKSKE